MINTPSISGDITVPLSAAVGMNRYEMAKWLIDKGADVNGKAPDGATALFTAIKSSRMSMIKLLLEHGADPNATVDGVSPLNYARQQQQAEIAEILLRYKAIE